MLLLAVLVGSSLLAMCLFQGFWVAYFVRLLRRAAPADVDDQSLPRVSILLSLRGADPHLAKGLRRLMTQNFPDYDLRIVVDQQDDPAWKVVEDAIRDTGFAKVRLETLREKRSTCSLKCSALVQLAQSLDDRCEVVVLADADLVSHADWLRDLVAPLTGDGVGATHGNRWFWPKKARLGSLVRYLWNVCAVIPMEVQKIPWGGTFAIRASVLRDSGLLEKWSRAVVEDAPVRSALADRGLTVKFVPRLMMVNREECGLLFSFDFIKRQLTWTKIYHPRWMPVVIHAFFSTIVLLAAVALLLCGAVLQQADVVAWSGGGMAAFLVSSLLLICVMERAIRRVVRDRGEETMTFSVGACLRILVAIPVTQMIHFLAVLHAMFRRKVAWRGVTYHVRGPWEVEMLDYKPFDQEALVQDGNTSL